jgi:hypothetical protein
VPATQTTKLAHVKLGNEPKEIPAGPTVVRVLKDELGVNQTDVLYLVHGHERRVLADDETLDVRSGQHFEAIAGGGVS